ncbi:MAG: hypothetical protein ABL897_13700 [Hyphomicrobium sp.]
MLRGFVALSALTMATAAMATEAPNAAHTIAQKFAAPTESAQASKAAPTAAKVEAPKPTLEKSVAAATERPPLDYEMEMLRRARAEQVAPEKTANTKDAAPKPAAPGLATAVPPATISPAAPASVTVTSPIAPAQAAKTPAAPVTKAAEVAPPAVTAPKPEVQAKTEPAPVPPSPAKASGPLSQATLLLALETGGASSKSGPTATFDPMICMAETCFVSAGLNADAVKLSKLDALKLKTTSDASPDSCKNKVACVFRNVAIPAGAQVQVVELGSASHDPSRASDAQPDATCKVTSGDLICDNPIASPDFRIWVVPEATAKAAGAQAIEDAVADGLPHEDVARSTDK